MPAESTTQLDAVDHRGDGVRVEFSRIGDRYAHTIYGVRGDSAVPIVSSVEDADYEGWPLSPPLQELRELTDDAGDRTLLLLGSAAYGHWSASIRSATFARANPYLEFDVAVRLHRAPAYLGVAYETVAGANWIDTGDLAFPQRDPHALCICAPLSKTDADSTARSERLKAFPDPNTPNRRLYLPTTPMPERFPNTYRWRYWIAPALA